MMDKELIMPYVSYNWHADTNYTLKYLQEPILIPTVSTDV